MRDAVKIALLLCATALAIAGLFIWFSPYQTCVRAQTEGFAKAFDNPERVAKIECATKRQ